MGSIFSSLFGSREEREVEPPKKPKPDEESEGKKEDEPRPTTDEEDDSSFVQKLLKAQNEYRLKHGAQPLTLDENMSKEAQRWAEQLASSNKLQHADTDYGENLSFAGPTLSAQQAADMWYNEVKDYNFSNPGFSGGTGHFTQLVWLGSKQFGAGIAKGSGGMFAVGRYKPAGNITNAGQFEANVLPAK